MTNIKNWLIDPNRDYQVGLQIYHRYKLNSKHDAFFNTKKPVTIHMNMLVSKVTRIYHKLAANPSVKEDTVSEPIKIKKIEYKKYSKESETKPVLEEKSINELRNDKDYINQRLKRNWNELSYVAKKVFNNMETYFLEKKKLFLENGDISKKMVSLHAKVKAINPDPKNDAKRKEIMDKLAELDDIKADNWVNIDTWKDVTEDVTTESETEKAVREAIEQDKKIKAHKIYIYRAEKSIDKMPVKTENQRKRKIKKQDEIDKRKKELKELGHPYKPE